MPECITSRENAKIKYACKLGQSAAFRAGENAFLAEGYKLCLELAKGCPLKVIYYTCRAQDKWPALQALPCEQYLVEDHVAEKLAGVESPQGVFGVFGRPAARFADLPRGGRFLALERVQDPGNVGALIRSAIEFSERRADEIMTPRPDVVGVPAAAAKEEIAAVFAKTGFSRLPVYSGSLDHISGVICQKDFHHTVYHTDAAVADIVRPVLFCPENQRIGRLLKNLQKGKLHLAVVVDEFGGTCGIVTLEDVLEELVGEIWDEHDQVVQQIAQTAPGEYTVLGSAHVADLFALLGRERQFSMVTVSGWIVETLGSLPAQGDTFEAHGLRVTVLSTLGRRVEKARVEVLEKPKAEQ